MYNNYIYQLINVLSFTIPFLFLADVCIYCDAVGFFDNILHHIDKEFVDRFHTLETDCPHYRMTSYI
jgi:hypothetical protein